MDRRAYGASFANELRAGTIRDRRVVTDCRLVMLAKTIRHENERDKDVEAVRKAWGIAV